LIKCNIWNKNMMNCRNNHGCYRRFDFQLKKWLGRSWGERNGGKG
jgi:hypothetical protein